MKSATFYLMSEAHASDDAHLLAACELATMQFRNRQKVWVYCESKQQAEAFDELLWQRPVDAFVPHNLVGEGPASGAHVEIGWEAPSQVNRPVLINLHKNFPDFSSRFRSVIDFVPAEETAKGLARERYKYYRAAGFAMQTQPFETNFESSNG